MFKLSGTLKVIKDTDQVTGSFKKREFVLVDASSVYPQDISFQAAQDKCSMLDGYMEGEQVEVSFNLRGKEWTSPQGEVKYFNTLDAWRIEKMDQGVHNPQANANPQASSTTQSEDQDDLPF